MSTVSLNGHIWPVLGLRMQRNTLGIKLFENVKTLLKGQRNDIACQVRVRQQNNIKMG
jgi:hypothetical protein